MKSSRRCWTQRTESALARWLSSKGFTVPAWSHKCPACSSPEKKGDEAQYQPCVPTFPKAPDVVLR